MFEYKKKNRLMLLCDLAVMLYGIAVVQMIGAENAALMGKV
jgi:hypothetical protein